MLEEMKNQVLQGEDLDEQQAVVALEAILSSDQPDSLISEFLVALADKGETESEIVGFASVMRRLAIPVRSVHEKFVDTAGTGGDVQIGQCRRARRTRPQSGSPAGRFRKSIE